MDGEDDIYRPLPTHRYEPSDVELSLPVPGLTATLALLRRAGRRESGVFWYGPRDAAGGGTVAYVVAPQQRMSKGNYTVPPEALARIVQRLPNAYKPLAQIHSHPGAGVEHSNYDDRMVSSRKALSLVFPFYGRWGGQFPAGIGVHEWQNDYWHLLEAAPAARRVVLVDGSVKVEDFR